MNQDWQEEGKQIYSQRSVIRLQGGPGRVICGEKGRASSGFSVLDEKKILPKKQWRRNGEVYTPYVRRQLGLILLSVWVI